MESRWNWICAVAKSSADDLSLDSSFRMSALCGVWKLDSWFMMSPVCDDVLCLLPLGCLDSMDESSSVSAWLFWDSSSSWLVLSWVIVFSSAKMVWWSVW